MVAPAAARYCCFAAHRDTQHYIMLLRACAVCAGLPLHCACPLTSDNSSRDTLQRPMKSSAFTREAAPLNTFSRMSSCWGGGRAGGRGAGWVGQGHMRVTVRSERIVWELAGETTTRQRLDRARRRGRDGRHAESCSSAPPWHSGSRGRSIPHTRTACWAPAAGHHNQQGRNQ